LKKLKLHGVHILDINELPNVENLTISSASISNDFRLPVFNKVTKLKLRKLRKWARDNNILPHFPNTKYLEIGWTLFFPIYFDPPGQVDNGCNDIKTISFEELKQLNYLKVVRGSRYDPVIEFENLPESVQTVHACDHTSIELLKRLSPHVKTLKICVNSNRSLPLDVIPTTVECIYLLGFYTPNQIAVVRSQTSIKIADLGKLWSKAHSYFGEI